ncbi:MAG: TonB-dependent receptor [Gemmatimonadaceae bacterium]|nr:TonB-dependent receptor [Gemmatimonadaceae bacterium]
MSPHPPSRLLTAPSCLALTLYAASVAAPGWLPAQRPDAARDSAPRRIEGVKVTSRQAPKVVVGSMAVDVSPDSLRTAPGATLDQALRTVPFVGVRTNSRGEVELSIRASDSRTPSVMLEGAPLSAGWDGRADPSLAPLTAATGLRVTRAAPSVLLGPNILGGVVEVSLVNDIDRPNALIAAGGDATGGVTSRALGATRLALGSHRLSLSAGAGHRQRDYLPTATAYRDPGASFDGERLNSALRQSDAFVGAQYRGTGGAFVGVTVSAVQGSRDVMPESHIANPRYWRQPVANRAIGVVSAGTGALMTGAGVASLQLRAAINNGHTFIQQFGSAQYATVTGSERGIDRTSSVRLLGEHSLGSRGDIGIGLSLVQVDYRESLNAAAEQRYQQQLWSAGVETDYVVSDALNLSASLALDGVSTPRAGDKPLQPALQDWAARLGLTRTVGAGVQLNAALINRSRFPSLRELYSGALNRFLPNPDLRPERVLGSELGLSATHGTWRWQAGAFVQRLDDVIQRINVPNTTLQQRVNRDAQRVIGTEFLLAYSGHRHSVLGDLTLQDARVLDPTQPSGRRQAEYQPKVRGSLTAVSPLAFGWRGTAATVLTGSQFCLATGNAYRRLPTTGRADLMADRSVFLRATGRVLRELRLLVALDNVTDALTWDQCGIPATGRVARIGFELR